MININNAVQFQHLVWDRIMKSARVVVDATCGNGHDLLYLAERACKGCHLYGIDIQEQAIISSRQLLCSQSLARDVTITFVHNSHDKAISKEVKEKGIDLIIFNLGYLPGGDHSIMTQPSQTITAVRQSLDKLRENGIITIVAYPGTEEGHEEKRRLDEYLSTLNQKQYNVCYWEPVNQINHPPILYMLQKR